MIAPGLANIIGFIGMALILGAYGYHTAGKHLNPLLHHGLNLTGALLLVLSLTVNRNLPVMMLESAWAAIALYGLAKAWRARGQTDADREQQG